MSVFLSLQLRKVQRKNPVKVPVVALDKSDHSQESVQTHRRYRLLTENQEFLRVGNLDRAPVEIRYLHPVKVGPPGEYLLSHRQESVRTRRQYRLPTEIPEFFRIENLDEAPVEILYLHLVKVGPPGQH